MQVGVNVFVVFGTSAILLYFSYIVGGGGARRGPGVRRTAKPKMTDKNTKSNLIWVVTNFDPPAT